MYIVNIAVLIYRPNLKSTAIHTPFMMTSSNGNIVRIYWPFVRGIHRSPVNSPHIGQWGGALMFSLICVWIKFWDNNREAGDLRRYRAHYDVIVMKLGSPRGGYMRYFWRVQFVIYRVWLNSIKGCHWTTLWQYIFLCDLSISVYNWIKSC